MKTKYTVAFSGWLAVSGKMQKIERTFTVTAVDTDAAQDIARELVRDSLAANVFYSDILYPAFKFGLPKKKMPPSVQAAAEQIDEDEDE